MSEPTAPTRLLAVLARAAAALQDRRVPWALVGGLAVSVRVEPRFTRDIDLAVAVPDDEAAEALIAAFQAVDFSLALSLEQQAVDRLAAVRLQPADEPPEGIVVDLLFVSTGIEAEICRDAEPLELVPGLTVPVARAGHLAAMKLLALAPDRPHDAVDLRALIDRLSPQEHERLRRAVAEIERRGTHRGKSLRQDLEQWLSKGSR